MNRNRLLSESEIYRLPRPPAPAITPHAFTPCPGSLLAGLSAEFLSCQLMIYQMAFQQAQAAVQPSLLERDLLAVWN
jgi:hypothetical protein